MTEAQKEYIITEGELRELDRGWYSTHPMCERIRSRPYKSEAVLDDLDRLVGWIGFQIENRQAHNAFCKESRKTYRKVLEKIDEFKELRRAERER